MTINSFSVRLARNLHRLARHVLMRRLLAAQDRAERAVDAAKDRAIVADKIVTAAVVAAEQAHEAADSAEQHAEAVNAAVDAELEHLGF
jgi:uracil phosphoribosyltransferase